MAPGGFRPLSSTQTNLSLPYAAKITSLGWSSLIGRRDSNNCGAPVSIVSDCLNQFVSVSRPNPLRRNVSLYILFILTSTCPPIFLHFEDNQVKVNWILKLVCNFLETSSDFNNYLHLNLPLTFDDMHPQSNCCHTSLLLRNQNQPVSIVWLRYSRMLSR